MSKAVMTRETACLRQSARHHCCYIARNVLDLGVSYFVELIKSSMTERISDKSQEACVENLQQVHAAIS